MGLVISPTSAVNTFPLQLTKKEKEKEESNIGSNKEVPVLFYDSSYELTVPDWSLYAAITHPIYISKDTLCLLGFHHIAYDRALHSHEQPQVDSSQTISLFPLINLTL